MVDCKHRWFRVKNIRTKVIYYARKGFGEDGTTVAVCELNNPCCTGWRFTAEFCKQNYIVLGLAENSEAFESRFQYELHR